MLVRVEVSCVHIGAVSVGDLGSCEATAVAADPVISGGGGTAIVEVRAVLVQVGTGRLFRIKS